MRRVIRDLELMIKNADPLGPLLSVVVRHPYTQNRDGAFDLLRRARQLFPFIESILPMVVTTHELKSAYGENLV